MRRVPAVRAGHHVSSGAGGSARTAVASGAAVGQAGPDGDCRVDVSEPVLDAGPLLLKPGGLPLEDLATTANRAERISVDDERRRVGSHPVSAPRPDLL